MNTTLFIWFGKDVNGDLSNSILSIDVSNPSDIIYTDMYPANKTRAVTPDPNNFEGLSGGAIRGIVAAVVSIESVKT